MAGRLAVGLTALFALAGDGPPDPGARLIDLNVVAVDGRGQPVNDLAAGDLQVTDNGKPQKIVYFHHNDSRLQQPAALAPGESSNRPNDIAPHVTLILLDQLNERFSTRAMAASQLVKDLAPMESADDLYLYLLTVDGQFHAVRGFEDGGAPHPGELPWTRHVKARLDEAIRTTLRTRPFDLDVAVRVQLTFMALNSMGAQLARFPGRKNIVWITDGVPIALGPVRSDTGEFVNYTPELRRLSELLDRSHISIYPVRQVMLGSPDAIDGGTGVTSASTLEEFARMTGGRADGGKDIGAAVRQAVSDVRTSYQIGYFAPPRNWDSKFHKLRVTTKRPGVHIQTKSGYYAWPDDPGQRTEEAFQSVLANPFDATEIGLRGKLTPGSGGSLHLDLHIDAGDLALTEEDGQYSGRLRVAVAGYRSEGLIENSHVFSMDPRFTAAQRDKALQEGVGFSQDIGPGGQLSRIRVVVFDSLSDSVGSITFPIGSLRQSR